MIGIFRFSWNWYLDHLGIRVIEVRIITIILFGKRLLKMCSAKWRSFGLALNMLNYITAVYLVTYDTSARRFKPAYEPVNLWVLKFSLPNKLHIFQCMGEIFHTKYHTHTLKDEIFYNVENVRVAWWIKVLAGLNCKLHPTLKRPIKG